LEKEHALKNPDMVARAIYHQMADLFEISAIYNHRDQLFFRARPHRDREEAVNQMRKRLRMSGFESSVREDSEGLLISVSERRGRKIPILNLVLFVATLVTMFSAPALLNLDPDYFRKPGAIVEQVEFTITLMVILLFHEFGHYLAGRRRGVLMSLPYFIPAPNIIGTFGAVIRSRSPLTNRRDLIEVGATGPIAGFVISLAALSIGLESSQIVQAGQAGMLTMGDSLLLKFLTRLIIGPIPNGYDFTLSPAAFAGWVGLLVTMLNLLPLGQLDGGHIIYGLIGKRQHQISRLFLAVMIVLGLWWPGWWFFGILVFLFGVNHPPTQNDAAEISGPARIMGWAAIIIFILCFVPIPFKMT
jgi:hypothetical protein